MLTPERRAHIDSVLDHCLHCGLCLPVCPTYALTADERSSPRGRIRLIRSVADGSLALSDAFAEEMHFCLDCQACQTACPAGVRYGELVEEARNWVADAGLEPRVVRSLKRWFLRGVLSSPSRLRLFGRVLFLYERTGLREAVERSGLLSLLPHALAGKLLLMPHGAEQPFDATVGSVVPAVGERKGRVGFLTGCVMNVAFPGVHDDAVTLLSRSGYEVVIPPAQGCCGSLHAHNGDPEEAHRLARQIVAQFAPLGLDAIVVDSAGCAAHVKAYATLLPGDAAAAKVASICREITEFLAAAGFATPGREVPERITYHDACHLAHSQGITREPRTLLGTLPGAQIAELTESTWCCGSAGIYNVARYDDSMAMLDRKMGHIKATGATIVATANPGCHLQLEHGARRCGLALRVVHPVTLLREATDPT